MLDKNEVKYRKFKFSDLKEVKKVSELKDMIGIVCVGREKCLTVEETHKVVEYMRYLNNFMEMWEELKPIVSSHTLLWLERRMIELEEKYLILQPVKKTITIEVEAKNKTILGQQINLIKSELHRNCKFQGIRIKMKED